jgi:hypothetical protein
MKRIVILAMLILALASIARAQADPCPTCNTIFAEMRGPSQAIDDNRWHPRRGAPPAPDRLYMSFDASVAVTNNTAKKIKQITWETSLINAATMKPIATYTLVTRKRIAPHKVVTLSKKVEIPLDPRVISANQTDQVKHGIPNVIRTEQVSKIREIEYTDGSVSSP